MGEVGELGPRKERWRRVGHLTGGGHPLSQSTSVTAPPLYHTDHHAELYHTQAECLAESRVVLELVLGGCWLSLVELLGAGRSTHCCWTKLPPLCSQTPPRRRRHLKPLISYTFAANLGVGSLAEKKSTLVFEGFEKTAPPKKG